MISSNNINIASRSVLSSPGAIRSELPLSLDAVIKVMEARQEMLKACGLRYFATYDRKKPIFHKI